MRVKYITGRNRFEALCNVDVFIEEQADQGEDWGIRNHGSLKHAWPPCYQYELEYYGELD